MKTVFNHFRYDENGCLQPYSRAMKQFRPETKGGQTICSLQDEDGIVYLGIAKCSKKDNFCYRLGRQIALGRARKRYHEQNK